MKRYVAVFTFLFFVALVSTSWGFVVPEWAPEDWQGELMGWAAPPVIDGDIAEWMAQEAIEGIHTFKCADHFLYSKTGEIKDALPDADDIDFQIWGGWCPVDNKLYFGGWVSDNVHDVNIPEGTPIDYDSRFSNDGWELEIDADGAGDLYNISYADDEEKIRLKNAPAQQWVVHAGDVDYQIVYNGFATWVITSPELTMGSWSQEGNVTYYEFRLTPFNDIDAAGETYEEQALAEGHLMGIEHVIADFDGAGYRSFMVLNQQSGTYKDANLFCPFVCGPVEYTAVEQKTWGQIKAALE
jgi:hypothetical protein